MSIIRIDDKKKTFETILSATRKLLAVCAPTYGPGGNKAMISRQLYKFVIDDGVQIARDFELDDECEQAVISEIKKVAITTNDRGGDGTTSSLIIFHALLEEIAKQNFVDGRKLSNELTTALHEARQQLLVSSRKVSTEAELERVAAISYDNPMIAGMVAGLLSQIGKDGVVTIDQSNTTETIAEHTDGIQINNGFISPYMITDIQRNEAVLEKPYILITNYKLTNTQDILPIMNKLAEAGKHELLLIADGVENDALATLVVNRMQGKFITIAVQNPNAEYKREFIEDLCVMTGAKMFSEDQGSRVEKAEIADLGRADKAIIKQNKTIIIGGKGKKVDIEKVKQNLKNRIDAPLRDHDKKGLEVRLARFNNGIAVIKVGAPTETELKALKYKVEDCINATQSAMKGGVVCGAGIALANINTSSPILNKALQAPFEQLKKNTGLEDLKLKTGEAYNIVTEKQGEYFKVGVIDPVDVLIAGIESAVSMAIMMITTHAIMAEKKEKHEEQP